MSSSAVAASGRESVKAAAALASLVKGIAKVHPRK